VSSIRSVARALLAVLGLGLVVFGVLTAASVWGSDAFPAGLSLGVALLTGHTLGPLDVSASNPPASSPSPRSSAPRSAPSSRRTSSPTGSAVPP